MSAFNGTDNRISVMLCFKASEKGGRRVRRCSTSTSHPTRAYRYELNPHRDEVVQRVAPVPPGEGTRRHPGRQLVPLSAAQSTQARADGARACAVPRHRRAAPTRTLAHICAGHITFRCLRPHPISGAGLARVPAAAQPACDPRTGLRVHAPHGLEEEELLQLRGLRCACRRPRVARRAPGCLPGAARCPRCV